MKKFDCPDMVDLLVDYLEDELDPTKKTELEKHLELCPPCVNFIESYQNTSKVCRAALKKNMPVELKSNLKAFLAAKCNCSD